MDLLRRLLPTPSRERFAARAVAALRSAVGGDSVRFDAESFRVVVGEGESSRIVNLGNFFTRYRESWPWQRAGVLRRLQITFQQAGQDLPESFAEVRDRLLPGIRDPVPPRFRVLRFPDPTTLAALRPERLPDF